MAILTTAQAEEQLQTLSGWTLAGNAIRKDYTFQDFPEAVLFVSALVPGVETEDHHPDIDIRYKTVTLVFSTHSAGGLTAKDFVGARAADEVAEQVPHFSEFSGGE